MGQTFRNKIPYERKPIGALKATSISEAFSFTSERCTDLRIYSCLLNDTVCVSDYRVDWWDETVEGMGTMVCRNICLGTDRRTREKCWCPDRNVMTVRPVSVALRSYCSLLHVPRSVLFGTLAC
jgi:hypothetical protein